MQNFISKNLIIMWLSLKILDYFSSVFQNMTHLIDQKTFIKIRLNICKHLWDMNDDEKNKNLHIPR